MTSSETTEPPRAVTTNMKSPRAGDVAKENGDRNTHQLIHMDINTAVVDYKNCTVM